MRIRSFLTVLMAGLLAAAMLAAGTAAAGPFGDEPSPIARGPHISGVVRYQPKPAPAPATGTVSSCSSPGDAIFRTDCNSSGRPVNETWVTYGNGTFYAGANDYNSYNGQGQNGFYWSSDGTTWNDAGPIDVFPHNTNNGAGDPGLGVDANGVVYYSSLLFNFYRCNVGGVELLRRNPADGSWSYHQIAGNSNSGFQDKPALAVGGGNVFVSWTQFGSCSGANVTSPIKVAVLAQGSSSVAPSQILSVPGSTYSQGSSIASDGADGFWIAWEEWPSATASNGEIRLAHWDGNAWNALQTISSGFVDLPSPLPGFSFRTDSFPALTVTSAGPAVVWTSYESGHGRAYLWQSGSLGTVSDTGGDQFMPAIALDGSGGVYVSYSQTNNDGTYDQWLWHDGTPQKASGASSDPARDAFFSGQFIGDYNGMAFDGTSAHPIWTDISGRTTSYSGWAMDSMIYTQPAVATAPTAPQNLTAGAGDAVVTLSWDAPVSDGGSPITGYTVYRDGNLLASLGTPTTYTDFGVTNGQPYSYTVTAVNGVGEGPASDSATATPSATVITAPGAPTNLAAAQARGRGIQLSWDAPASDGGSPITGYTVYRSDGTVFNLGTVTSYKDTQTARGQTYSYTVTAVNSVGEGPASNEATATAT
jgi:hypothetical protein